MTRKKQQFLTIYRLNQKSPLWTVVFNCWKKISNVQKSVWHQPQQNCQKLQLPLTNQNGKCHVVRRWQFFVVDWKLEWKNFPRIIVRTIRYQNNLNTKNIHLQNKKSIGEPYKYGRRSSKRFGSATSSGKIDCWRSRQEIRRGRILLYFQHLYNFLWFHFLIWWWILVRKRIKDQIFEFSSSSSMLFWFLIIFYLRCWFFALIHFYIVDFQHFQHDFLINFNLFSRPTPSQCSQSSWKSCTRRWRAHGRPREPIEGSPFHGWGSRQEIRWGAKNW